MTKGELLILGKLTLTFVVLLGIPLWELYSLRRDRLRSGADEDPGEPPADSRN